MSGEEKPKRELSAAEIKQRQLAAARPKTMTDAALQQRKDAAAKSTGPKTEAGKAAVSRNAWKTGEYSAINNQWLEMGLGKIGKPCLSTCPQFDTCTLVEQGLTKPGQDCLDKTAYVQAFDAIMDVMTTGDMALGHGMLAHHAAGAFELLTLVRNAIHERGIFIEQDVFDKNGEKSGTRLIFNPAVKEFHKMATGLGINLGELLATPAAQARVKTTEQTADAVTELFEGLTAMGMNQRPGRTINVTPEGGAGE